MGCGGGGGLGTLYSGPHLRRPFKGKNVLRWVCTVSGICLTPHPSLTS